MTDEDGSRTDDLHLVAEEFGCLIAITCSELEPGWVESVHFDFESGYLRVDVDGNYDTVKWEVGPKREAVTTSTPDWSELLSTKVSWIWVMTNHRGFTDGFQIEFNDNKGTTIQMMALGSQLRLHKLTSSNN